MTRSALASSALRVLQLLSGRRARRPPESARVPTLPVALVAALKLDDRLVGVDGEHYRVTSVGPGAIVLEPAAGGDPLVFTNRGYAPYSWAYYAAPRLHWLM